MDLYKSDTFQEKSELNGDPNEILLKTIDTQDVIRKKFEKACMNRLEREHDVNQAMKPLTEISTLTSTLISDELEPRDIDFPFQNSSKQQLHSAANKSTKSRLIRKNHDPNELCDRLRILLTTQIAGNVNQMQEIQTIIAELRNLEVIV